MDLLLISVLFVFAGNSHQTDPKYHNLNSDLVSKWLSYLGSVEATPEERVEYVKKGISKIGELSNFTSTDDYHALDCRIRQLAFEFSIKLQPGKGDYLTFKAIHDALELSTTCKKRFSQETFGRKFIEHSNHESEQGVEIFVDQANGRSNFDGSFSKPVADIQLGIDLCNKKRANDGIMCTVYIRGGSYHIKNTLKIRQSNVKLVAYKGEHAIVTSDVVVQPKWKFYKRQSEDFKGFNPLFEGIKPKQTTKNVIFIGIVKAGSDCSKACEKSVNCTAYAFFDSSVKDFANQCFFRLDGMWNPLRMVGVTGGKKVIVYSADLGHYNLSDVNSVFINGRRAIRARFPNANPETMGLHTLPTGYVSNAEKWLAPHPWVDATEISIENPKRKATLFPTFTMGIGGPVSQFEPPESYWGSKRAYGAVYRVPSGLQFSKDLEINKRLWKNAGTGVVHVYHGAHWANWMFKLDNRDDTSNTLHWSYGGFQEARGSNGGREWYVENIFEELDSANEWFFDKETKVLYYFPNGTNLPTKLSIPQLPSLVQVIGSQTHPVRNVVVQGLTFEHTTKTFLEKYMVPSGGDWSVHKNAAVFIEGSEKVTVTGCTFDSPEGNGLLVSNYNRDAVISHNTFRRLGDNGIVLLGDTNMIDGSGGDQPRRTTVLSNIIYENGIWGKQTYAFVQARSCLSYVKGNVFFTGPRAGISINDGLGGGNEIDGNLLFNFVRETDDHGPINTWDRIPYLTKVYDGETASLKIKENQIHHNFIINNYRSIWPIDHDDGTCFWNDTYNYLVYGGYKSYLGHHIHSMHNVYIYPDRHLQHTFPWTFGCIQTAGQTLGTSGYGDTFQMNKCIIGQSDVFQLGNCDAGHLSETIPNFAENSYYTPKAGFLAHCGKYKWTLKEFQGHGMEINTSVQDLVDDDTVIKWGRELLEI